MKTNIKNFDGIFFKRLLFACAIISLFIVAFNSCQKDEIANYQEENVLKSASTPVFLTKIISAVENLKTEGILSKGSANSLIAKINSAIKSYSKGNINLTANHLSTFKTSVNNLIIKGLLTQEQGDVLTDMADDAILLIKGSFTDSRDGNIYPVTIIGDQIWMAKNLAYLPEVSPPDDYSYSEKYYYVHSYFGNNVDEAKATLNYQTFGVLYNWPAAMDGNSSSNSIPSGVQGVCPLGWHLPSNAEWGILENFLGGWEIAGGKLKETGTTHWGEPNTGATNLFGFTALPGGAMAGPGSGGPQPGFCGWVHDCYIWTTTETAWWAAYQRFMYYNHARLDLGNVQKWDGQSVRCVKD